MKSQGGRIFIWWKISLIKKNVKWGWKLLLFRYLLGCIPFTCMFNGLFSNLDSLGMIVPMKLINPIPLLNFIIIQTWQNKIYFVNFTCLTFFLQKNSWWNTNLFFGDLQLREFKSYITNLVKWNKGSYFYARTKTKAGSWSGRSIQLLGWLLMIS